MLGDYLTSKVYFIFRMNLKKHTFYSIGVRASFRVLRPEQIGMQFIFTHLADLPVRTPWMKFRKRTISVFNDELTMHARTHKKRIIFVRTYCQCQMQH